MLLTGRFAIRSGTYAVPIGGEPDGLTQWEVTIAKPSFLCTCLFEQFRGNEHSVQGWREISLRLGWTCRYTVLTRIWFKMKKTGFVSAFRLPKRILRRNLICAG